MKFRHSTIMRPNKSMESIKSRPPVQILLKVRIRLHTKQPTPKVVRLMCGSENAWRIKPSKKVDSGLAVFAITTLHLQLPEIHIASSCHERNTQRGDSRLQQMRSRDFYTLTPQNEPGTLNGNRSPNGKTYPFLELDACVACAMLKICFRPHCVELLSERISLFLVIWSNKQRAFAWVPTRACERFDFSVVRNVPAMASSGRWQSKHQSVCGRGRAVAEKA